MADVKVFLRTKHSICVQDEWLRDSIGLAKQRNQGRLLSSQQLGEFVFGQWLLADLQEIGRPCLPDNISNEEIITLEGNFCLQVNSFMDVGQPAYSQLVKLRGQEDPENLISSNKISTVQQWKARPSRMLILQLTDGTQSIEGMEYQSIPALQATMTPGIKIEVYGKITCRLGMLLLTADNVKVLGGEVGHLIEEKSMWKMLHQEIGLDVPADGGPVNSEAERIEHQTANAAPTNVPSTQRSSNTTSNIGGSRAGTGSSNQSQQHRRRQQSMRSFNSASYQSSNVQVTCIQPSQTGHTGYVQENRQVSTNGNSETAVRNGSRNDSNPSDEIGYFEIDEFDENFDFDQLDESEKEGQQVAESMDMWTDDFDAIPDEELLFETSVDQSDSSEVTTVIEEPSKTLKMEHSLQFTGDCGTVSTRNSLVNTSGQSAKFSPHANFMDSSSSTGFKLESEASSDPTAGDERLLSRGAGMFNPGAKRPAVKQDASVQGQKRECAVPITYLSQSSAEDMPAPSADKTIRIKAYVVTLVSHSQPTADCSWSVTVKLNDGTATLDVDLAPQVLTELLGFPVKDFQNQMAEVKRTRDPTLCRRLQKRTEEFQKKLAAVSCLMDVHFSPTYVRPRVQSMLQPTSSDVTSLIRKVRSKMAPHV